jgi:NTP pyrophosphatase (non-canonical NTP hydrolase)
MNLNEAKMRAVEAVRIRLKKKGIKENLDLMLTHLMEEIGELALQVNNEKLKRKPIDIQNVGEELSDCIILLLTIANHFDIDIEKALLEKMEEIIRK